MCDKSRVQPLNLHHVEFGAKFPVTIEKNLFLQLCSEEHVCSAGVSHSTGCHEQAQAEEGAVDGTNQLSNETNQLPLFFLNVFTHSPGVWDHQHVQVFALSLSLALASKLELEPAGSGARWGEGAWLRGRGQGSVARARRDPKLEVRGAERCMWRPEGFKPSEC